MAGNAGNPIWRFDIVDPAESEVFHLHMQGNGVGLIAGRGIGPSARRQQLESARNVDAVGGGYHPFAELFARHALRWGQ
jgi:hypothetical protein